MISDIWAYVLTNPRKLFLLALAGILLLWIVFGDYGVLARFRMEAENRMLRMKKEQEEMKIIENQAKIQSAQDSATIEQIAREKYNFMKEDETLFILQE